MSARGALLAVPSWRARLLEPGWGRVLLAAVATVLWSLTFSASVARVGEPFAGFFVWENLFIPAVGEARWTGATHGVDYHTWLRSADGRPLATAADLDRALAGKRAGDVVRYEIERAAGLLTVDVPVMTFDLRAYLLSTGNYMFNAFVLLGLGITMLYLRPYDAGASAVFYFCTVLSLYLTSSVDLFGPYRFRVLNPYLQTLAPVGAMLVVSHFPVGRRRRRFEDAALALGVAVAVLSGVLFDAAYFGDPATLQRLLGFGELCMAASVLCALLFFVYQFVRSRTHAARQRTKVVLAATAVAFLPALLYVPFVAGLVSVPLNFVTLLFLAFPLGITYAIAKHDLFDIDRVLKRGATYFVLSIALVAAYAAGLTLVRALFGEFGGRSGAFADALVAVPLLLAAAPGRVRLQHWIDGLFDRRRREYREVVGAAARRFRTILDFESLADAALDVVELAAQPTDAGILAVDGDELVWEARVGYREGGGRLQIDRRRAPAAGWRPLAEVLRSSDFATAASLDDDVAAAALPDGALALALRLEHRLTGILYVGPRRDGGYYRADDVEALATVCGQLAVALENARAYGTIGKLNEDLERSIAEVERSNRELRKTQAQLIEKERLAAIGELAGAVAHALRNPLAGIRAAAQYAEFDLADHAAGERVRDIVTEADRLNARISALLRFSKPFEPVVRTLRPVVLVRAAVDTSRARAAERDVTLEFDATGDPLVKADDALLEQAVLEGIANAIDASEPGGSVAVSVATVPGRPGVSIKVEDRGEGLGDRDAERVFELFHTTKPLGTGFGLASARRAVEAQGGTVTLDNRAGGGAVFEVHMPGLGPGRS